MIRSEVKRGGDGREVRKGTYPPATITPRFSFVDCAGFSHVFICALLTHLGLINMDRAILAPRRRRFSVGKVVVVVSREAIAARAAGDDMSRGCILSILIVCMRARWCICLLVVVFLSV